MPETQIENIILSGEDIHTEFKRCSNGFEKDTYETVCAFSNRFGEKNNWNIRELYPRNS